MPKLRDPQLTPPALLATILNNRPQRLLVATRLHNRAVVKLNELILKSAVNGIMNSIDIYTMPRFKINYLFKKKNNDMI